ncbi:MAG TPA: hypothetical protein VFN18_10775 [Solirubrobacterales bacterium]|nr:hypothetical protein [Solirubrobacterales bacterium]
MPSVPLSKFVEFTVAQGTSRVRIVADSKKDYEPQRDFYKRLRELTQRQFVDGWDSAAYKRAIKKVATSKKLNSYEACRRGVTKWASGKQLSATKGSSKIWSAGGLDVRVNPELDLSVNGSRFSTKLYFALDEPSGPRLETLLYLLAAKAPSGRTPAVLDLRRGRLITIAELDPNLGPLLRSDAAAFVALYS